MASTNCHKSLSTVTDVQQNSVDEEKIRDPMSGPYLKRKPAVQDFLAVSRQPPAQLQAENDHEREMLQLGKTSEARADCCCC